MHRVGVIGDLDSVIGFRGLGMTVAPVSSSQEAAAQIERLARENYAVILITEPLADANQEIILKYRSEPLPAIIPIPSLTGSTGSGMRQVRDAVRKAVGIDILGSPDAGK